MLPPGHYTFGRAPDCDVVLEHPSSSRLHAVLVFHPAQRQALLYDHGSTHGTEVNKKRVNAKVGAAAGRAGGAEGQECES